MNELKFILSFLVFFLSLIILIITIANVFDLRYPLSKDEFVTHISLLSNNIDCFKPLGSYVYMGVDSEKLTWELAYSRDPYNCTIKDVPILLDVPNIVNYQVFKQDDMKDITRLSNKTSESTIIITLNEELIGKSSGIKFIVKTNDTFSNIYRISTQVGNLSEIGLSYSNIKYTCGESCFSFFDTKITDVYPVFKQHSLGSKTIRTDSDRIVIRFNPENTIMALLQPFSIALLSGSFLSMTNALFEESRNTRNRPEMFKK